MIILLEGADGTGKTTLANKLVEKLNAKYIHLTWNKELDERMLAYQTEALIEAFEHINLTSTPCIIDRHWLSESIYSHVYRNGPKMPWYGRFVEHFIDSVGGFTIICIANDLEKHAERFNKLKEERKEMYDNVTNVAQLYNSFYFGDGTSLIYPRICPGYLKEVMANGGAYNIGFIHKNYMHYDIEYEGKHLDEYVEGIAMELEERVTKRR